MSGAEVLARLRAMNIDVRTRGGGILCRPRAAVTDELRRAIVDNRDELLALLASGGPAQQLECPGCRAVDYLPLGSGWRRCWQCGRRWGPPGPAPKAPADLDQIAAALHAGAPDWARIDEVVVVHPCPRCGTKAFIHGPEGPPQRRCHGCDHIWTPELKRTAR